MYKVIVLFSFLFMAQVVVAQNDSIVIKRNDEDLVFNKVEQEASFPGGLNGWQKYLMKNLNPQIPIDKGAPAGLYQVIVRFIVDRNGHLSDIQAETNNGYGTEEEVIRIIKRSGDWIPATQNGRKVNAYRRQPVTFAVDDGDTEFKTAEPYVFFIGIDNVLEIKVDKVKNEDLDVTVSGGTIKLRSDGKYIVRVTKPGRVLVEVFNTKKNNKSISTASFLVKDPKQVPPPIYPPGN
jgi:hypothetical protein